MISILVVGGAGFIGSHMVKLLGKLNCKITTLDNLSSGYRDAVLFGKFVCGDIADRQTLYNIFQNDHFDAVMHFASYIQVGESVQDPSKYYDNNVVNTINLLNVMQEFRVKKFIFSSTAAIFGEPKYNPLDEQHPQIPINPYGRTKLMVEQILTDYEKAYNMKSICLRYFNAAGADPENKLGERHNPETHLIPLILQVASGRRSHIDVYGNDYDTVDGTCIRDYIHVEDICDAHWLALKSLMAGAQSGAYNIGNGNGFSVKQIIDVANKVSGCEIKTISRPRRNGDPAKLVADARLAHAKLGWKPKYTNLQTIIEHAWNWEKKVTAQ